MLGTHGAFQPFGQEHDIANGSRRETPPGITEAVPWDDPTVKKPQAPKLTLPEDILAKPLSSEQLASMAIITGDMGKGSAFFCKWKGHYFAMTNAHVLSGNSQFELSDLHGNRYTTAEIFVGRQFDVALIRLNQTPPAFLEIEEDPLTTVSIGDAVIIPGNARGGGVITQTQGKLLGIGPELVEVDAKFVPGNSGSPILHTDSGKVLGLATFITKRKVESFDDKNKDAAASSKRKYRNQTRWFGFRIDTIKEWESLDWPSFSKEGQAIANIEARTNAFIELLESGELLRRSDDPKIQQALDYFNRDVRRQGLPADYYRQRFQSLMRDLRNAAAEDLRRAENPAYAYHQQVLSKQRDIREEIISLFEQIESRIIEARRQSN